MKCEWRQDVSLYVDDELEPARQQEVAAHLRRCAECAAAVMEHTELKKAVRIAGRQFSAPPELRAGIRESLRSADVRPPLWRWSFVVLSIVAVAVLGFVLFSIPRRINPEIAELVDQHITTLASASPVRLVRKVLRRIVNIQARKFVPCRNEAKPLRALAKVSCTRSRASSASPHSQPAKLYKGSSRGKANISKSWLGRPLTSPRNAIAETQLLRPNSIPPGCFCSFCVGQDAHTTAGGTPALLLPYFTTTAAVMRG